jgi:NADH-quinone oxidoreductase subunit N
MAVGVTSIIVSVRASLVQRRAKRFLAYSAIGHVGYIRIGLMTGSRDGIQGLRVYVMIYSLTALLM